MSDLERWRLVKQFTVYQAALLSHGYDPALLHGTAFGRWPLAIQRITLPVIHALQHAVIDNEIPLMREVYHNSSFNNDIDFDESLIHSKHIIHWYAAAGNFDQFFRIKPVPACDFDDRRGPFYAPKLAAANAAWRAVTADPKRLRGKSVKQALQEWLEEHAAEYGLLHKGKPNATGIEDIAKVANWRPNGGAPATPEDAPEPSGGFGQTGPLVQENPYSGSFRSDLDDEIPF
ncbi:hypothetical protein [Xanthobacter autotrophicus]|uniref:hypothetical protein n=1 Tax=Xanthobacter autotrophicus TaxID=280 RepID=UPI0024A76E39|nr:hypothetical protein [Xanthobacter autotrophicus]MDI4654931.1 hypothetical protein [Xanthobacter autotrophicus]